jgi:hypothetical protein
MTSQTVSGYPFDGYDGSDESFERLISGEDPEVQDLARRTGLTPLSVLESETEPEHFHNRVNELVETEHLPVERAIERAAYEIDHPSESVVAAGRCGGCEKEAGERIPWGSQKLCWDCVDAQLDLMALAVAQAVPVPVMVGIEVAA